MRRAGACPAGEETQVNATRRLVRKDILRFLERAGELGSTAQIIHEALRRTSAITVGDVERDLQYLAGAGKDYVKLDPLDEEGLGRRLHAVILPRGIDLLEGNIAADPGVA